MVAYLLLLLIPALFYFVSVVKNSRRQRRILFGQVSATEEHNLMMPTFFLILLCLLCLRSIEVGRDLKNYQIIFRGDAEMTVKEIFEHWRDPFFELFNNLFSRITENFQWYLTVVAVITVIPIAYVYCKDKTHSFLKILIFVNMSTFCFLFSGIRQGISLALGMLAFDLIKKKKTFWFLAVAAIATLMHVSGFIIFALYPLYYIRFKKKHLYLILPASLVLLVFNRYIFALLAGIFSRFYDGEIAISSTGAFTTLLMFAVFAALSYILMDEKKMTDEDFALRNILLAATWMQCFAPLHSLAMRMNYYFIMFVPISTGRCFAKVDDKYKQLAKWMEFALCIFFLVYFLYTLYVGYTSGHSALDTIPYIPFWAN